MIEAVEDRNAGLRRSVYALLIAVSVGSMLGRILAVDSVDAQALERVRVRKVLGDHESLGDYLAWKRRDLQNHGYQGEKLKAELDRAAGVKAQQLDEARLSRPFLSANDRSRWCTLRALVEPAMRVEGAPYAIDKVIAEPNWDTIDMVKHDGHLYSSKPPLFPTLMAAEYWLIQKTTGRTLATEPYAIGRFMLITVNVLPLVLYFWLLAWLAERFGTTDWGRLFVIAAAAFGTFLTTFAVVINNHLPAAVCTLVALYAAIRIWFDGQRRLRYFVIAGLAAAFCVANELPAAAFCGLLSLALLWKAPKETLVAYVPAALVVTAAFFATNWIAHQSLRPPYMHRSETNLADNWYDYEYEVNGRTIQSYWRDRVGIDRGEPSVGMYVVHALVGHHGVFSLTPIWLMTVAGLGIWLVGRSGFPTSSPPAAPDGTVAESSASEPPNSKLQTPNSKNLRQLALLITILSLICLVFYLTRPLDDRNYGGMTSAFRWMFWFTPMWLAAMLPAADWMAGRRWGRALALVLLVVSVLSATYPTWNPWTHPWLLNYLHYLGWVTV
jgi:hypothetical protein